MKEQEIQSRELIVQLLMNILPNLNGAITIAIFISLGNSVDLGTAMEMIHLFNWIRSTFTNLMSIRASVFDAQIFLNRIQRYLCQEEVQSTDLINRSKLKDTQYAVRINHQNFSWGLRTMDVDNYMEYWSRGVEVPKDEPRSEWMLLKSKNDIEI